MARSSGSSRAVIKEQRRTRSQPGSKRKPAVSGATAQSPAASKSVIREYAEALIIAGVAAFLIKTFFIQAFRIPSGSMEDTLLIGDFLLVNKFIYGARIPLSDVRLPAIREPKPGDIIVFQYPEDPTKDYIKRCIAVGGQTVEVRDKVVDVDGVKQPLPPLAKHIDPDLLSRAQGPRDDWGPVKIPAGTLFMMGDNRDNSKDSRFWGPLDRRLVRGKALIIYMSWDEQPGDPEVLWTLDDPLGSLTSILYEVAFDLVHIPWRVRWGRIGHLIE
ncbi:MAG: signal peptidase I [Candidatus Latescibacteria bacterium]|nr:signal peptidase I [Candidatus Latescibacterota bacterium]